MDELEFPEQGPMAPVEEDIGAEAASERAAQAGLTEALSREAGRRWMMQRRKP